MDIQELMQRMQTMGSESVAPHEILKALHVEDATVAQIMQATEQSLDLILEERYMIAAVGLLMMDPLTAISKALTDPPMMRLFSIIAILAANALRVRYEEKQLQQQVQGGVQ